MTSGQPTVAEVVQADARAAEVLEAVGIDYCCHGDDTVTAACARAGLEPRDLLRLMEAAPRHESGAQRGETGRERFPVGGWETRPLVELTRHIVMRHHAYTRQALSEIGAQLIEVAATHGQKHAFLIRVLRLFTTLEWELPRHMDYEESAVFPSIGRLEAWRASQRFGPTPWPESTLWLIPEMRSEHRAAADLLHEIRRECANFFPPAGACAPLRDVFGRLEALERDFHWHAHLENNILFPRALKLTTGEEARA